MLEFNVIALRQSFLIEAKLRIVKGRLFMRTLSDVNIGTSIIDSKWDSWKESYPHAIAPGTEMVFKYRAVAAKGAEAAECPHGILDGRWILSLLHDTASGGHQYQMNSHILSDAKACSCCPTIVKVFAFKSKVGEGNTRLSVRTISVRDLGDGKDPFAQPWASQATVRYDARGHKRPFLIEYGSYHYTQECYDFWEQGIGLGIVGFLTDRRLLMFHGEMGKSLGHLALLKSIRVWGC